MKHFKVDADFYLNHGVDLQAFAQMLVREFSQSNVEQIHKFKINLNSPDTIEIEFFVETNTYREANDIAKKYLSSLESQVNEWLEAHSANSKVTDESLILMPA